MAGERRRSVDYVNWMDARQVLHMKTAYITRVKGTNIISRKGYTYEYCMMRLTIALSVV
jgi:hypothetical protein